MISLASGDLNGDGQTDLVWLEGGGTVRAAVGRGDGTFTFTQTIALPDGIGGLAINLADVTHDGKPDIILGSHGPVTQVAVLPGRGDGTFGDPIISNFSNVAYAWARIGNIGIGDVNGDGVVDLVVPDGGNNVLLVLLGDNSGKFRLAGQVAGYYSSFAYLVDLNHDSKLDVWASGVLVNLGNGDGTFQPALRSAFGAGFSTAVLSDLDGDGLQDLVTCGVDGTINIQKGKGDGTFAAPTPIASLPVYGIGTTLDLILDVADVNGDGMPDIIAQIPAGVGILLGKGNLTFQPVITSISGATQQGKIVRGDFNKDGHLDLAMAVEGGVAILLGQGDGTFASTSYYDVGQTVGQIAVADFNGDAHPDIAVGTAAAIPRLLLGAGNGKFSLATDPNPSPGTNSLSTWLAAADFNGDGKSDLLFAVPVYGTVNPPGTILPGKGDGTFGTALPLEYPSPAIGDVNGDGRADVVSIALGGITVELAGPNGSFAASTVTSPNMLFQVATLGDVNHDGKIDAVVRGFRNTETWLGNGDGTFRYVASTNFASGDVFSTALADVDGDGVLDIVGVQSGYNTPSALVYCLGSGDGTFRDPILVLTSRPYSHLRVADLDSDGRPDFVLSSDYSIAVMMNLGGGHLAAEQHYVAGTLIGIPVVVDVNGDGLPDIVASTSGGTTVAILLNKGAAGGTQTFIGTVSFSPEPSGYAAPFLVTFTAAPTDATAPLPTGSVNVSVDGTPLGSASLTAGRAALQVARTLTPGTHAVTVAYNGDGVYGTATFIANHAVDIPVYSTTTSLTAAPAAVMAGQTVSMGVTVTSSAGSFPELRGSVTFRAGSVVLATKVLDNSGTVRFTSATLPAGSAQLTATYNGLTYQGGYSFAPSSSSTVPITVSTYATSTSLYTSAGSVASGSSVALAALVASQSGTPFGGVTFFDGGVSLGTFSVRADGTALFSARLTPGRHVLSATYNANGPFAASQSSVVPVFVGAIESGWWWDPKLSGIGFFIESGGSSANGLFLAGFLYDSQGASTWLVSTGPMNGTTYSNNWLKVTGGPTLSGNYRPPAPPLNAGNIGLSFSDSSHAVLSRPDGTQVNLERFSFTSSPTPAPAIPGTPQSGWWWGGAALSGTGYAIEFQGNSVFMVAYSYDASGNPVWYLSTGTLTSPTTYNGTWDVYVGGPQLNSPEGIYSAHRVTTATPMGLAFTDATHGTLTMGTTATPISRFQSF